MDKNRKAVIVLVLLILIIATIKLDPFASNASSYRESKYRISVFSSDNYNIVPFSTINEYIFNSGRYNIDIILRFFITNAILCTPVGFFMGLNRFNRLTNILAMIVFPIALDLAQTLLGIGVFDIDAVMINILSCLIIFAVTKKLKFYLNRIRKCR